MTDLYLALTFVSLVSLGALTLALRVGARVSREAATALCVFVLALIVAHVLWVSDRPWVARALPLSSVVVLGNALPPLVATFAGLAWRLIPGNVVRRGVLLCVLVGACTVRSVGPVLAGARPETRDRWRGGVCLQTSPATCSAAAAATLLRAHGIAATESEMARLCLTRERGTAAHGLYRGLKLKTAGTAWDVEVFDTDPAGLRAMTSTQGPSPCILTVRLDPTPGIDPRYEQLWGWTPGVRHTVVAFRFTGDGKVEMGDPSVGREHWSANDLGVLWHGEGMRLVRR